MSPPQQDQQQPPSRRGSAENPYNPYQQPQTATATGFAENPFLPTGNPTSGTALPNVLRSGLGESSSSGFRQSPISMTQQQTLPSAYDALPNFYAGNFPNPELYPSAHTQRPPHLNPYAQGMPYNLSNQTSGPGFQMASGNGQGQGQGGMTNRMEWYNPQSQQQPMNQNMPVRRVSMPPSAYSQYPSAGLPITNEPMSIDSPPKNLPGDTLRSWPSTLPGGTASSGTASLPVSPNSVSRVPLYDPWNTMGPGSAHNWTRQDKAGPSQLKAPVPVPAVPDVPAPILPHSQSTSTVSAPVSEHDSSRPSSGGPVVKDEPDVPPVPRRGSGKAKAGDMKAIGEDTEEYGEEDEGEGENEKEMDHRKRKRNRTIRSCVPCHNHKRKVCLLYFP